MTIEQGFLWVAEAVMFFALACFIVAFRVRKDVPRHRFWGQLGVYSVFGGLVALEVVMRGLGWDLPVRDQDALRIHLMFATASLVFLIGLLVTGMMRWRGIHTKLYWGMFPSYLGTLVMSLFAFDLWG